MDARKKSSASSIESPPLSIAVMIDIGMANFLLNHYVDPFGLLSAALVGDDEAAIYQFDYRYTVEKVSDFTSSNDGLGKALRQIKKTSRG
jgi:hypothetical protein